MGACLATCCGSYCGSMCASCDESKREARTPFLITMFLGMVLAAVLRFWATGWAIDIWVTDIDVCTSDKCYGYGAAYRVSFVLFTFFAIHALACLTNATQALHRKFWLLKVAFLIGMFFLCYVIPNSFFAVYSDIARFVSAVFLLLQIVVIVNAAYDLNERLVSSEPGVSSGDYGVLGLSLALLGGALTLLIFCFEWFDHDGCDRNKAFLALTIIMTTVALVISMTAWCEHGALLPSSVVTMYAWYLAFSSMSNDPDASCNHIETSDSLMVSINMCITAAALTYASYNLSKSLGEPEEVSMLPKDATAGGAGADEERGARPEERADPHAGVTDEEWENVRKRNLTFHLVMSAASMYVAMILTNWGFLGDNDGSEPSTSLGTETVWIIIASQWLALLLYLWTLVAPYLLSNREF